MALNSTLLLTLFLLSLMFGAGLTSASWGFSLGRQALKGITQPDVRPTNSTGGNRGTSTPRDRLVILNEKDILKIVKARIEGRDVDKSSGKSSSDRATAKSAQGKKAGNQENSKAKFPINSRDGGVILEITSARLRSNSLLLDVSMKNEGSQSVRFLYSFLNVTDDQGRALSAIAEDLPGELPPNSQVYYGTVSIPTALLDNAKLLSLTLTDYPNQKLQLQVSGITVPK
ncbi:hypothetical protein BCD67_04445 [Oscillatoriales cyanobacterium USR001]|nr:hypothetical protein BCD67_04445 [Oscillatoriales cyanobacterium USR001]